MAPPEGDALKARLRTLQKELLEVMETSSFGAEIEDLRENCGGKQEFGKWVGELVGRKCGPIYEKHEASHEWQMEKTAEFAEKDERILKQHRRFEEILSYESLGPMKIQKGDCMEVHGLQSESGKLLNGQKCTLRGYDEQKGRYEVRFVPEKLMHIKPDNLKRLDDKEILLSVQSQILDQLYTKAATDKLDGLRDQCSSSGEFQHTSGEFLGGLMGPIFDRHGVDGEWLQQTTERLAPEVPEASANLARYEELTGFGKLGGADVQKGDCVRVSGLTKEEQSGVYALHGLVRGYDRENKTFEVSLPVGEDDEKIVHVKAAQLKKLDDAGKVSSIQVQLLDLFTANKEAKAELENQRAESTSKEEWEHRWGELFGHLSGPILKRHGVDLEWFLHVTEHLAEQDEKIAERGHKLGELASFGSLGPLELSRGTCVEVRGVTTASEQKFNGHKGVVKGYKSGLYEVGLVPEKLLSLKPENIKVLDDHQKVTSLLSQLWEAVDTSEVRGKIDRLRAQSTNAHAFGEALEKLLEPIQSPAYQRHGSNGEWLEHVAGHLGEEDPVIGFLGRRMQALTSFGAVPAFPVLEPGAHVLVGGHSERLNDQVVIVKGWDASASSYDCLLADDLAQSKSLKQENLRWIPGREFESPKEAEAFQAATRTAWDAQFARDELAALKAQQLDAEAHRFALRPLSLRVQRPVLERFGFRPDFGGQVQVAVAMGALEAEHPQIKSRNVDLEVMQGLPDR